MCATPSVFAISEMSVFCPLNWNDEVREATSRSGVRASALRISSVRPSANHSCSSSEDMLTNGSTAIDFSIRPDSTAVACGSTSPCRSQMK
jgi:hypothetical protein